MNGQVNAFPRSGSATAFHHTLHSAVGSDIASPMRRSHIPNRTDLHLHSRTGSLPPVRRAGTADELGLATLPADSVLTEWLS